MKRRSMIETSATLGLGALAGCALPGTAAQAPKTPFAVTDTFIPIVGSDLQFPVRRIYCIGRNYAAHAREMGSDPTREPPFFFQKPTDAIQNVAPGTVADHPYPTLTKNYHYEVELVAALRQGRAQHPGVAGARLRVCLHDRTGHDAPRPAARDGRREEAVGDRQELRPLGGARAAAPGVEQRATSTRARSGSRSTAQTKQNANLKQMIWNVAEQISKLSSQAFELMAGDIIYSGTPENVGPVVRGDVIDCHIDGLPNLGIKIV